MKVYKDNATEMQLVLQAKMGDETARELIAELHRPAVQRQAKRMLRSAEDQDDAIQDTFVKAFRALHSFDATRPMAPWLLRICSNCCVDIIRSRRTQHDNIDSYEHSLADDKVRVDEMAETKLIVEKLKESISRLPKQYRQIIEMRHYGHMDVDEIACALGKPEGTIKSWLFRARALLRKDMQPAIG
jgi:RNA polymerase sigma-70 factor (ECF subfamily)